MEFSASVRFIHKEFVTMHGHTILKLLCILFLIMMMMMMIRRRRMNESVVPHMWQFMPFAREGLAECMRCSKNV
jgi:hypothetical protein